jgi:inosine-uridine nucleoside N-ribohydrolase
VGPEVADSGSGRPRVILDCDPGLDDAAAIAVADHFADLIGITTVSGNAPLAAVTANALLTAQVFGIDVEVYAGAARPLVAEPVHAAEIHGTNGFSGPSLPELTRSASSVHAVEYLIETVRAEEGLWLIPVGPMTNVALVLRQAPDLAQRLAGISFMGGSARAGNRSAVAEFNVMADPEAAAVVLGSGARILMAGLDLTHQFVVDDGLAVELRRIGHPGAVMLADLVVGYLDRVELVARGRRRGGLHDPCAVMAVTHPELITHVRRRVDVELTGTLTRGMTVIDQRWPIQLDDEDGNVWHGHTLDYPGALTALLAAVSAYG